MGSAGFPVALWPQYRKNAAKSRDLLYTNHPGLIFQTNCSMSTAHEQNEDLFGLRKIIFRMYKLEF